MSWSPQSPDPGGEPGGLFRISVVDCDFELNQLDGCRIDVDYETFAAWDSHIVVRGSRARANGAAGFHLDLDARCDAILERVRASANLGDGLLVSSESAPGMAVVHASSFDANAGRGIAAAQGHFGLLVSRCLVSANAAGGMTSPVVPSSAVSSLAVQQDDPWGSLEAHGSLEQAEGLPLLAQNLPLDWARIVADESGILVLDREPGVLAAWGETADDGTPRELTWLGTDRLRLDPPPSSALPLPLALFAGADVREDYRLTPGSAALGAGLAAPFALPTDAGPCASGESVVPGREAALPDELFRLARSLPAWSVPIAPQTELRLEFEGGIPAASTLAQGVWVLSASGVPLVASLVLVDGAILVTPPAGGWQSGQRLELHPALRSTTDAALAGPLSIPIRVP